MAGEGIKQCDYSLRSAYETEVTTGAGSPGLLGYCRYEVQSPDQVKVCKSHHLWRALPGCGSIYRPGKTGIASRD